MIKYLILLVLFVGATFFMFANEIEQPPKFLFKVMSLEDWKQSEGQKNVKLSSMDHDFIHLAEEGQVNKVIEKFWSKEKAFVVIKLDTSKLTGRLVLETNPKGTTKYYHLYDGKIPLDSVVDVKKVKEN